MTIINKPTQLLHTPSSTMQNVPAESSSNAYFSRYWREEYDAENNLYLVDRVYALSGGEETGDGYALGIQIGDQVTFLTSFEGNFLNDTDKNYIYYLLQIVALEKAEDESMAHLSPLDLTTEQGELESWLETTYSL